MIVPSIINLELTNRCNMACVFCDHEALRKKMRMGDMEDDTLVSTLVCFKKMNVYELGLVGLGEPLLDKYLNKHLWIIAKHRKSFTRISLNSNGTLMDEYMSKIILESPVNLVTFSLNATNRKAYRTLMKRDLFSDAVSNIKRFIVKRKKYKRADMKVSIQFMSSDLNEEREMRDIFKGYIGDKVIVYNRYVFNKPALEKLQRGLVDVNPADFTKRHPCWSMYSRLYVDIDGNAYPCTIGNDCYRKDSKLCIGNVRKHSLMDIFNNRRMAGARKDAEYNRVPFPECRKCTAWELLPNNFEYVNSGWVYVRGSGIRRKELDRKD